MPTPPAVVVTGIGLRTGLGNTTESGWQALKEGRSGVRRLGGPDHPYDFTGHPEAKRPDVPIYFGCPIQHSDHRPLENLMKPAMEAVKDALLAESTFDPARAATVVGMSKGDLRRLAVTHRKTLDGSRFTKPQPVINWLNCWPDVGSRIVSVIARTSGPRLAPVAACATGVVAVLQAADLIRRGACDLAIAGAGDSSLEPLILGAFRKMRVLARVGDDPRQAIRPWDRKRSGFLVGEGAAILVLERADHARARGVLPYAEVAGGALGADGYHETNLNTDPTNLAGLIGRALENADVRPSDIDYVNVHGTATRDNDPLECRALRRALGPEADRVSCSANKAQIGHLLGAAGAAELAITCLAIRDGFVPPTLNLDDPDPACDLDGTPHVGRSRPIRAALKLSLGFGGHLAACVLRRPEGPRRVPGDV
jgi:3-oxoacyl-[acyl-carrier-protein] synthase II